MDQSRTLNLHFTTHPPPPPTTTNFFGAVSEILSTLSQVSLGHFYFEIALIFRDSLLISKMVYSSEIWYNISNNEYKRLEEIDEMYMRKIFDLPKSTPRIGLYAECGKIPIRNIIQTRRLLFYWHILHLEETELVFRFYLAQKFKPGKNDWILTVYKDMKELGITMSDNEVKKISLIKFKEIVLSKIKIFVRKSFEKKRGSKTAEMNLDTVNPSSYLFSKLLNKTEIQTLFKLRTRTIDVKKNQESSYKNNMWCRVCCLFTESQEHLLDCHEIRKKLRFIDFSEIRYQMIFGNLEEQEKFTKSYQLVIHAWEDIKNISSPSSMEDPCTSSDVGMRQIVLSL